MLATSRTSQPAYGETVTIEIVDETHSRTEDNDRGIATGWLPGSSAAFRRAGPASGCS